VLRDQLGHEVREGRLGMVLAIRRSDRVLSGGTGPRSHAHFVYTGLEVLKAAGLLTFGVVALTAA
jgi:hypothetical protein